MGVFCKTPEFKALNIGFVLDEGIYKQTYTYSEANVLNNE
jgi:hypothetical protein